MAIFRIDRRRRFGIRQFVDETTRRRANEGRIKPEDPEERAARLIEEAEIATLAGEEQAQQSTQAGAAGDAGEQLSPYDDLPRFSTATEEALVALEGARDPFYVALDSELVENRPDDASAFELNRRQGAIVANRRAIPDTSLDDLHRTIGIFPKEPTQAALTIQTYRQDAAPIVIVTEFILATVSEASQEKYQIFETFDKDFIYFFDRNPHVYSYGGVLYNSDDFYRGERTIDEQITREQHSFEWKNKFQRLYETTLRGTKCVERGARAILNYENVVRQGFLLDFQISEDARNPHNIPFSFTFFVVREENNHISLGQPPDISPLPGLAGIAGGAENEELIGPI